MSTSGGATTAIVHLACWRRFRRGAMLQRLRVKNFKLLRDVEIEFGHPLTVLIGPNSGGKSTMLEVIEFLRKCADRGLQEAVRRHGGAVTIRSIGTNEPIEIAPVPAKARKQRHTPRSSARDVQSPVTT